MTKKSPRLKQRKAFRLAIFGASIGMAMRIVFNNSNYLLLYMIAFAIVGGIVGTIIDRKKAANEV